MKNKIFLIIAVAFLFTLFLPATVYAETSFREASIDDFTGTVKVVISGGQKEYSAYKGMGLTQGDTVITGEASSVTLYVDDDKEIILGANSRLTLSELSNYTDPQSKATGLKLWVGKIWVNVKKKLNIRSKFEITTGSTVMGVKGTRFYVGYERTDDKNESEGEIRSQTIWGNRMNYTTNVCVLQGTVIATLHSYQNPAAGGRPDTAVPGWTGGLISPTVTIHAGQMITISDTLTAAPPPPVPILPQNLPLLVLQQISQNPQEYDPNLSTNLEELIRQRQEAEEMSRLQREAEQSRRELESRSITYMGRVLNPISGNTPTQQQPGPNLISGNETVTIDSPVASGTYNTQGTFSIIMTATDHENDLMGVKVSLKKGTQYYNSSSGLFNSANPSYIDAVRDGSKWVLNMSANTWTAFKSEDEFDCLITAIANDGADGRETKVTFRADNIKPALTSVNALPKGIYPDLITGEAHEGTFTFSEVLSSEGKSNVINAIKNVITSGNDNLTFAWSSTTSYPQLLSLGLTSQNGGEVLFNDTSDITTTIYDWAGNQNTVKIFDVGTAAVSGSAINARNVYVEAVSGSYITPNREFTIPLPDNAVFNNNIVLNSDTLNKYATLDGVLKGCAIESIVRDNSGDHPTFIVTLKADQNGNITVPQPGEGTITLSRLLWSGSGPLRSSINFTTTGIELNAMMFDGPYMLKLEWQTQSEATGATVYVSTTSVNGPYTIVDGSQSIYSNTEGYTEGYATVNGLALNQDYWFKVFISGGETAGYTKTVHYRPGDIEDMSLYIANAKYISLFFGGYMATYECTSNNDNAAVVYNAESNVYYVVGRKVGSTVVTVTSSTGIVRSFTVTVLPTEITEVDASPNQVQAQIINNGLGIKDNSYFYVTLLQGEFTSLGDPEAMYNVILEGALKDSEVLEVRSTEVSNTAEISLATESDDVNGSYVPVSEDPYAYIVLSDVLWGGNGSKAIRARIQISLGAN